MAEGTRRDDPFAIFLKPPANETAIERATREARAAEAKKRSDAIDEELRKERQRLTRTQRGLLKAVLVGDSGSGREKMVKQLRMRYAREEWDAELAKWKSVIQLRILKGVVTILDALQSELDGEALPETSEDTHSNGAAEYPFDTSSCPDAVLLGQLEPSSFGDQDTDTSAGDNDSVQDKYLHLLIRLAPIRYAEENLRKWLDTLIEPNSTYHAGKESEEATGVITRCQKHIKILWRDETVKAVLRKRRIKLEESAQFFLEEIGRIISRGYAPSDEDVALVCSRVGIQEYRIKLEQTVKSNGSRSMCLYDIGDWRMARNTWTPYFEGVDAVMFCKQIFVSSLPESLIARLNRIVASLSSFDELSPQDPETSQLEDSLLVWGAICRSRSLKRSGFVLFLTNCDVLRRKLKRCSQMRDYLPSFGNRPNDPQTVAKYFKDKFRSMAKQELGEGRFPYIYLVSTVDIETAEVAILAVKDILLRENIKRTTLV